MGVIMHNNISYGGGSTIEPNPAGTASTDLTKLGIDGVNYNVKDANAAPNEPTFTEASTRENLNGSGETIATIFGKIKKWFSDLKDLAFIGKDGASSTKYLRGDGTWQNFPTIPAVNDATLTIQKNGTAVETFTANSSTNKTANITVPTKTSDLTNDSGFVTTDEKVTGEVKNPTASTTYNVPFINGTTNQKPFINDGLNFNTYAGTTSTTGRSQIRVGNSTETGTAGNKYGELIIYSEKSGFARVRASENSTADRTIKFQDKSGTVALTSDITDEKVTGEEKNPTSGAWYNVPFIGTSNQKPYYNDGVTTHALQGTTSAVGRTILRLGNETASGTAGNKRGELWLCAENARYVNLKAKANLTSSREIYLPDAGGTIMLGTTYEYNKEIAVSGSSRYILIGKFPCYDSNVTIRITNTTSTTSCATVVLGTQNINDSHGGVWTFSCYGDENYSIAGRMHLLYPQNSRIMEIYFDAGGYSKNTIHIQAVSLNAAPTNIVETVSSIPSGTITATNIIDYFYVRKSGGTVDKAKELIQLYTVNSRPTDADLASNNNGGIRKFLATSAMTSHKPMTDGHIIQLDWDNSNFCASQIFVPNSMGSTPHMQFRAQGGSNTWSSWVTLIDSNNIGSQAVDQATKDGDGNTISSTYAKKASVYKSAVSDSKSSWTAGEGWFADTIGPETKGVYVFIGWAEFDGSLGGRRGIKLARHNSSSTVMASAFTSESADSGYPRTVTCVEYVTCGTDAAVSLAWRRLRLYTANSLSSGTIKGGVIMIKISDL